MGLLHRKRQDDGGCPGKVIYSTSVGRQPRFRPPDRQPAVPCASAVTFSTLSRRSGMKWQYPLVLALSGVVAAGVTGGGGKKEQDLTKTEMDRLQGTWKVIRMEEGGEKAMDKLLQAMTVTINGDKIKITEAKKVLV